MKNKLIWVFIVIVAINGLLMTACDIDDVSSINGVWQMSGGTRVTVNGSNGVYSYFGSLDALWDNARSKNIIKIGDQHWRYLTSTGSLTWSGQTRHVTYTGSTSNATGSTWVNITITLSANGQSIQVYDHHFGTTRTWTRW